MKNSNGQILAFCVIVGVVILAYINWPQNFGVAEAAIHDLTVCRDDAQAHARNLKQEAAQYPEELGEVRGRYEHAGARINGSISQMQTEIDAGTLEENALQIGAQLQNAYDEATDFCNWVPGPTAQGGPPVIGGGGPDQNNEINTVKEVAETFKSLVKFSVDMRREVNKDHIDSLKKRLEGLRLGRLQRAVKS